MRVMYDSVTPDDIPPDAQLVGGYVDGKYAWTDADWARFPKAVHVRIACLPGTDDGQVLDVENGDATPGQAPEWCHMRRLKGADPTVYCNLSTWSAVRQAFQAHGEPEPHYWIALWNGQSNLITGAVAHQYADGKRWDLSMVADFWPGVDPGPPPAGANGATTIAVDLADMQAMDRAALDLMNTLTRYLHPHY